MRNPTDLVAERATVLDALASEPFLHDFFQVMRRIEALHPDQPRLGHSSLPTNEPVRVRQAVALDFAPATVRSAGPIGPKGQIVVEQNFFGYLGPNGPLPIQLTDVVRDRIVNRNDPTMARFLDHFGHRFALLLYRAWVAARPTASYDRPSHDRYSDYVGAFIGLGTSARQGRDSVPDAVKRHHSSWLSRHVRTQRGLSALVTDYFRLPTKVEGWCGHWMQLPTAERSRLGARNASIMLGGGAVLGKSVWDRQHKFRLLLGPLSYTQYESLLPGQPSLTQLDDLVRLYFCDEYFWDANLVLRADEVPPIKLGRAGRLGWSTWLGLRSAATPADDLKLDVVAWAQQLRRAVARPEIFATVN